MNATPLIGLRGANETQRWTHVRPRRVSALRTCRPGGYCGTLVTHGTVWALLGLATFWSSLWLRALAFSVMGLRLCSTAVVSGIFLRASLTLCALWLVPFADVLSFLVWCVSLPKEATRRFKWVVIGGSGLIGQKS